MESRRRYLGNLGVVIVVAQLALFVSAQGCLLAAEGKAVPFRDDSFSRLPNGTQAIITSYKFGCCGNITAWQTYVQGGGRRHQEAYDITFQVWRPSPTFQESGCYSMVGENRYTSVSLGGGGGLVSETPEPSNVLTVQPGDVVGYYTLSRLLMVDGIQLDDSQSVNSVWYDTISGSKLLNAGPPNCPFPVGTETDRILTSYTSAAPVLLVSVSSFTCPPTPTISPSSSSSLPSSTAASSVTTHNTNAATATTPISEGSAALSTAVIASVAAVGLSALLLTLLCMLLLAITIAQIQRRRQRTLAETSSIVVDQQVNTLPLKMQGNEAYMTISHTTDGDNANTINTESNLAYETVNTGCEGQNYEYEDIYMHPVEPLDYS